MKIKGKYLINSFIATFLVSGLLINGFCIYAALAFNEGDYFINKLLFIICGILLLVFLINKIIKFFQKIKSGTSSIGKLLKEMMLTILFSVLWIIFFFIIFRIC